MKSFKNLLLGPPRRTLVGGMLIAGTLVAYPAFADDVSPPAAPVPSSTAVTEPAAAVPEVQPLKCTTTPF